MSDDDLDLHAVIAEAQRHAPACYKLGISFLGPWERGMSPEWLTLSVSRAGAIIEWEAIKTAGATHGSIVGAFERLIRCAIVAKIRDDNAPVASTVYTLTKRSEP